MFAVMPMAHHPALLHMEPPKYLEPSAHIYTVSCEELEALMNWDHILRPVVPVMPADTLPCDSVSASTADAPCDTSASETETGKRCTPEPTKQTRAARKRS